MKWWERIMLFVLPRHHSKSDSAQGIEVAFARLDLLREQVAQASDQAKASAIEHTSRVEAERNRIRARTEETAAKWPDGKTSAMREQVDALVARQERRNRDH